MYLTGLAVARIVGERRIVWAAAVGSVGWGLAGLTLLPRLDVAGGLGRSGTWRSPMAVARGATYAGVFFVVAALELYGTSIGAWHWTRTLPGLGITDGNPPSGAASGYVGFDVMAMLVAPTLVYAAAKLKPKRATRRVHKAREPVGALADGRELAAAEEPPRGLDSDTSFRAPTRPRPPKPATIITRNASTSVPSRSPLARGCSCRRNAKRCVTRSIEYHEHVIVGGDQMPRDQAGSHPSFGTLTSFGSAFVYRHRGERGAASIPRFTPTGPRRVPARSRQHS